MPKRLARRAMSALLGPLLVLLLGPGPAAATPPGAAPVTVYAAASLANALREVGAAFTAQGGPEVRFSFASSSSLARQIESGAPVDGFVSADTEWMDYLASRSLIDPATRRDLLGNRLVLIAPADSRVQLTIARDFPIAAALGDGRLATGDPESVPVGRYARAALTYLNVWTQVEKRLVRADNTRSALHFVALGEAPLGVVYETDARVEPRVRIVGVFPPGSHPAIVYPAALAPGAPPAARAFLAYLSSPSARAVFARHGFTPLG